MSTLLSLVLARVPASVLRSKFVASSLIVQTIVEQSNDQVLPSYYTQLVILKLGQYVSQNACVKQQRTVFNAKVAALQQALWQAGKQLIASKTA